MAERIKLIETTIDEQHMDDHYHYVNGYSMKRETGSVFNGVPVTAGWWVLRDESGVKLDVDKYRSDLQERFNLQSLD